MIPWNISLASIKLVIYYQHFPILEGVFGFSDTSGAGVIVCHFLDREGRKD